MADNGINSLHFFIINKTFEFINRTGMESSIVVKEFLISFGSLMFLTVGSQWSELYAWKKKKWLTLMDLCYLIDLPSLNCSVQCSEYPARQWLNVLTNLISQQKLLLFIRRKYSLLLEEVSVELSFKIKQK